MMDANERIERLEYKVFAGNGESLAYRVTRQEEIMNSLVADFNAARDEIDVIQHSGSEAFRRDLAERIDRWKTMNKILVGVTISAGGTVFLFLFELLKAYLRGHF